MAVLRSRLRAGERVAGGLVRMPCEELVEMIAVAGLDFVLIDCEHGPADVVTLRRHIAFADAHAGTAAEAFADGAQLVVHTSPTS